MSCLSRKVSNVLSLSLAWTNSVYVSTLNLIRRAPAIQSGSCSLASSGGMRNPSVMMRYSSVFLLGPSGMGEAVAASSAVMSRLR